MMMNYDTFGACGPVGCGPYGYPGYGSPYVAPFFGPGFGGGVMQTDIVGRAGAPAQPPVGYWGPQHVDIVGQNAPAPPPAEQPWLQKSSLLGITNQNLLIGTGLIALTWFAWSRNWLPGGGPKKASDFGFGEFFY